VASAGLLGPGNPAAEPGVTVASESGLDLTRHRSRRMSPEALRGADLVLGMASEHVREAVLMVPEVFPRAFTLRDLLHRGQSLGPRKPDEPVAGWLARAHLGRTHRSLLAAPATDDVPDPIGGPRRAYETMLAELTELVDGLVELLWPAGTDAVTPGADRNR